MIISQPPKILSIKDNMYICDMLANNLRCIKTISEFRKKSTDQEITNILESAEKMHIRHYDTLLESLQDCEN
ncbi:spore coat protein [Mycoplasmatota bacterium]|nr:spore coat protein [Mycoplasmatota bacterium]